jgi:hypothetical protein
MNSEGQRDKNYWNDRYDKETHLCVECGDPLEDYNEDLCDWCGEEDEEDE